MKLQKGWSCQCPGVQSPHDTSHPPAATGHCQEEEMPLCAAAPPGKGTDPPLHLGMRTGWEVPGNKQSAPLWGWQDGERGQFPPGQAQTPSHSSVLTREWSHHRHEAFYCPCASSCPPIQRFQTLIPLCRSPRLAELGPGCPGAAQPSHKKDSRTTKTPPPPDQLNGQVRMFTQIMFPKGWQWTREVCTPGPIHTYQEELHMYVRL